MQKFDRLILDTIVERVLTPERLNVIMTELRKTVRDSQDSGQDQINALNRQLKEAEARLSRLYEAVERGGR